MSAVFNAEQLRELQILRREYELRLATLTDPQKQLHFRRIVHELDECIEHLSSLELEPVE